jgi:hypothetical protein
MRITFEEGTPEFFKYVLVDLLRERAKRSSKNKKDLEQGLKIYKSMKIERRSQMDEKLVIIGAEYQYKKERVIVEFKKGEKVGVIFKTGPKAGNKEECLIRDLRWVFKI